MLNQYNKVSDTDYLLQYVDWSGCAAGCSCWNWTGCVGRSGYPETSKVRGYNKRGNRLAYTTFIGPIPKGMLVLHKCDNRLCINPNHLWLGSVQDNHKDMEKKGRNKVGTKLTKEHKEQLSKQKKKWWAARQQSPGRTWGNEVPV